MPEMILQTFEAQGNQQTLSRPHNTSNLDVPILQLREQHMGRNI